MLSGFTLALALVAIATTVLAVFVALYAIGQVATLAKRTDTIEIQHAEMQGHRLRIDGNIQTLARNLRLPDGAVVLAKSPERPQ